MNNNIYGMTGAGDLATTAPFGNIDHNFDTVSLAKSAGATFVARTTTYHATQMIKIFEAAIKHKGFSVVEVLSQCPTYYGRKNKKGSAVDMVRSYKENTVLVGKKDKDTNPNVIERGIFLEEQRPEYCDEYNKVLELGKKE